MDIFPTLEMAGFGPSVPCGKDFLVKNLAPGTSTFTLSTAGRPGEIRRWASAPVEVSDRNIEITMTMSAGADISGRIVTADGTPLPPSSRIGIATRSVGGRMAASEGATQDPNGKFLVRGVTAVQQQVMVMGLANNFYVKEIRYNGQIVADGIFTPIPGAPGQLDIVIDDQAATISGTVAGVDRPGARIRVQVLKSPPEGVSLATLLGGNASAWVDDQGQFQIGGLAPGEYRVFALTDALMIRLMPEALLQFLSSAEKVTLERGGSQSVSLKIVEP